MNYLMVLLIFSLLIMCSSSSFSYKHSLSLMMILLYYIFILHNLLLFYFLYELMFMLILFSILLMGYSYERLFASYLMLFYSFVFSSPIMMMLLLSDFIFMMKSWLSYSFLLSLVMLLSFLVKFPVFGFHYWLPVAHVEASTIGSMILAGVLLKVGCLGLFYLVNYFSFMIKMHWMSISVLLVMSMILFLSDLKMMIAYSSVAHMSMVAYVLMTGTNVGKKGAMFMMYYHGVISPLMFWLVGSVMFFKSRSIMILKHVKFTSLFFYLVFVLIIMNMSLPPFLGFLSEIYMLKSIVNHSLVFNFMSLSVLFCCFYNVYLFKSFCVGNNFLYKNSLFSMDVYICMILVFLLNY